MSSASQPEISAGKVCEQCGSYEVMELAGRFLCADCVAEAGCACAGHADDVNN